MTQINEISVRLISHVIFQRALRYHYLYPKPCVLCKNETADGHHPDYARPFDVQWLCRRHHMLWHMVNAAKYPTLEMMVKIKKHLARTGTWWQGGRDYGLESEKGYAEN